MEQSDKVKLLAGLFGSRGWQEVLKPELIARCNALLVELVGAKAGDPEDADRKAKIRVYNEVLQFETKFDSLLQQLRADAREEQETNVEAPRFYGD